MAFTPDPNLFANSLGAGMRVGSGFADLFRQRKQEGELRRIAQMAASGNPDYNQIGAGLIGAGQVGAGVNALGVPFEREQIALEREAQREDRAYRRAIDERDYNFRTDMANRPTISNGFIYDPKNPTNLQPLPQPPPSGFMAVQDENGRPIFAPIPGGPNDPNYLQDVAGAKKPAKYSDLPVNAQKLVAETDDIRVASQNTIATMTEALRLNEKAYSGPTAGLRGMVSGAFGAEGGEATTELDNLVKGGALGNLKAIFGGMPTEGERKILLDISGSADNPAPVREKIYTRAIAAAMAREEYNTKKAAAIRDGSYYDAGFDPAPKDFKQYMPQAEALVKQIKSQGRQEKQTSLAPNQRETLATIPADGVQINGYTIKQVGE
jgi:hypothetical protein